MKRFVQVLLGFSFLLVLAGVIGGMTMTPFFWLFYLWPHLLFAGLMTWQGVSALRIRGAVALSMVSHVLGAALLGSFLLSLSNFWNDGSGLVALPMGSMLKSVLSGGFLPQPEGPLVLLRFVPLGVALGLAWCGWRRNVEKGRLALICIASYLVLAFAWQIPSFIAAAVAAKELSIETAQDAFSALVRSQSDGFWTPDSTVRFLAPFSDQGKNAVTAIHGAFLFLLTLLGLFGVLLKRLAEQSTTTLKKMLRPESGVLFVLALATLALGQSLHISPRISFTLPLAICIFLGSMALLLVWIFLRESLANLAKDEIENPDEPLPSGQISVQEAEELAVLAACFSVSGFALLGWPVLVGVLGLFGAYYALQFADQDPFSRGRYIRTLVFLIAALGIAWSGTLFGLRELSPAVWMVRLGSGLAIMIAGLVGMRDLPRQAVSATVILGASALISGQWIIWVAAIPALTFLWFFEFQEKLINKRFWPLYAFAGWYFFMVVFFPSVFQRI